VSVFTVVFLKAERLVVPGFPDVLRNQRSEVLKNFVYEVRPRKNHRGVNLISDALPLGRLWYGEPNEASNAIDYAKFRSRSHDAPVVTVIGKAFCDIGHAATFVFFQQFGDTQRQNDMGGRDDAHEHAGDFNEP
jgi:hypothetical protein